MKSKHGMLLGFNRKVRIKLKQKIHWLKEERTFDAKFRVWLAVAPLAGFVNSNENSHGDHVFTGVENYLVFHRNRSHWKTIENR